MCAETAKLSSTNTKSVPKSKTYISIYIFGPLLDFQYQRSAGNLIIANQNQKCCSMFDNGS